MQKAGAHLHTRHLHYVRARLSCLLRKFPHTQRGQLNSSSCKTFVFLFLFIIIIIIFPIFSTLACPPPRSLQTRSPLLRLTLILMLISPRLPAGSPSIPIQTFPLRPSHVGVSLDTYKSWRKGIFFGSSFPSPHSSVLTRYVKQAPVCGKTSFRI